jgi:PAS domain S-box-containing protein
MHPVASVLCVDDDPTAAETVARRLEATDGRWETTVSADPGAAPDRLERESFDCVVCAHRPGRVDALAVFERVRERDRSVGFVLLAPEGDDALASEAVAAGVTGYVAGEVDDETLADRVQRAVDSTRRDREREATVRAVEMAGYGVSVLDADGRYVRVEEAYAEVHGLDPSEMIGEHWTTFVPAETVERHREHLASEWLGEATALRPDGTAVPVDCAVVPVADGNTVRLLRDATDRVERERELAEYETLVDALNDPVYVVDETGRFTSVNEAFCELTGYDESTVLGSEVSLIKDEATVREAEEYLGRLLSATGPDEVRFEAEIQTADGETVHCEDHMGVLPYDEQFRGSAGVLRDISERKERERRLNRQNDRLEEFASVVSHDLRDPLHVASGNLDLVRRRIEGADVDREVLEYVDRVGEEHDRMSDLIDEVLALARQGEVVGTVEPLSLRSVVEDALRRTNAPDLDVEVVDDATVAADHSRLVRALSNLFGNAADHAGPDATVRVGTLADGFYVADDGPGIPESQRDQVFDPGHTTADDGTGFGLPIVERIVEAHGWAVEVTEADGGGARFEVRGVDRVDDPGDGSDHQGRPSAPSR